MPAVKICSESFCGDLARVGSNSNVAMLGRSSSLKAIVPWRLAVGMEKIDGRLVLRTGEWMGGPLGC